MMIKILFICHGNICRSPMAAMIMTALIRERGLQERFSISSAATSTEEIGNGLYPPARAELIRRHVPLLPHTARQMTEKDAEEYDLLICMDRYNLANMKRLCRNRYTEKMHLLSEWSDGEEIADPWYSDRFDIAYEQIQRGCEGLLEQLSGTSGKGGTA